MKKYGIYIIVVILVAIVLGRNLVKKDNNLPISSEENKVQTPIVENVIKNETNNISVESEKKVLNETVDNSIKETVVTEKDTGTKVYEQESDIGSTDKKQEAINLVKQKWGEDENVTFRCDHVTGEGEYIIAVVSKDSANVKNYFRVNLEKNTVVVDY